MRKACLERCYTQICNTARIGIYNMACSKAISEGTTIPKSGIIFVEARIRDNVDLSVDETKVSECHSFIDITLNNSSVDTRCP